MKITTEIQRKVKLLHLLNEKVICLTQTEKKKFTPKLDTAILAILKLLCFKIELDFPNFSLNLDFQDSENETQGFQ